MNREELRSTAQAMGAAGKGILAADESTGTMTKRLEGVGVDSTEESRRAFRDLLFTADGASDHISGVIMYDETLRQSADDGKSFPEFLESNGMIPGIKVDTGAKPMAGAPDEKITEGLDGLRERLEEYHELGARFAKWRAVITIGDGIPTDRCIEANAHALARYAALCQENDIVPIVEPEVLMDGEHSIDVSEDVTERTLKAVFDQLFDQQVWLPGVVLKPNMVLSAYDCPDQASVEEVAERTIATLRRVVPAAVPSITFLSGGQTDEAASAHLNAMNKLDGEQPWQLSFSYGRALQAAPLGVWGEDQEKVADAQAAFMHRARCNGAARDGRYSDEMERELVA